MLVNILRRGNPVPHLFPVGESFSRDGVVSSESSVSFSPPSPFAGRALFNTTTAVSAGTAVLIVATVATAVVTTFGFLYVLVFGRSSRNRGKNCYY